MTFDRRSGRPIACKSYARIFLCVNGLQIFSLSDAVEFQMAFDRRSGRPIACDMVRVDANSVSVEVLSEERYIGSVVQEAKPPKQKNVRVRYLILSQALLAQQLGTIFLEPSKQQKIE